MAHIPNRSDEFHEQTAQFLEPELFFGAGKDFLAAYAGVVVEDIIPRLTELEGRWHPLGFAVLPLMVREDGSSVRLHIWPEGRRKGHSLKRPAIHDHAWHLISRVLTREAYQDSRYGIQTVAGANITEDERKSRHLRRLFRAHYPPEPQELHTDGTCVLVTPIKDVVVPSGQYNCIAAGEYHLDKIPIEQTVATLCLDSPKLLADGPHVIVDGPADTVPMNRLPLAPEDLRYIQGALQKAVLL